MKHKCVELFAGVGGFRLGLERSGWDVTWSNQWEPGTKRQLAADIYRRRFGDDELVNEDICQVKASDIPDHDLLVGGFPCQDYSIARPLNQSEGIQGKKGVLWWEIFRILQEKRPTYVLLENVSRLLSTPVQSRGRDFVTILACLQTLDYVVEWRVVDAADYGYPQSRKRVFILAYQKHAKPDYATTTLGETSDPLDKGILGKVFPYNRPWHDFRTSSKENVSLQDYKGRMFRSSFANTFTLTPWDDDRLVVIESTWIKDLPIRDSIISNHIHEVVTAWDEAHTGCKTSPFSDAGISYNGLIWTVKADPIYDGPRQNLESILQSSRGCPEEFFIPDQQVDRWKYLKGAKKEQRIHKETGMEWEYSEGAISFPDALNRSSRTIITGEGGRSPSRFKHVIQTEDGRYRRLTPVELERLNGFPDGWTGFSDQSISSAQRAFLMGNALVVGIVEQIGKEIYASTISV